MVRIRHGLRSQDPYQVESFSYYTPSQDPNNAGRLESIVLQGYDTTLGSLVNTRMVTYSYYGGSNIANGLTGDLESAQEQVWSNSDWSGDSSYYYTYSRGTWRWPLRRRRSRMPEGWRPWKT